MENAGRRPSKQFWSKAYQEFRQRLVEAREDAGLSQQQVADMLKRPQSFVAKSETGELLVDVIELAYFAALY